MNNSPLRRLPAELLNDIATLALQQLGGINILYPLEGVTKLEDLDIAAGDDGTQVKHPTALAQTCKQMYSDYMPVFYSQNTFTIKELGCDVVPSIKNFLKAIGPKNVSAMPGLLVDVQLGLFDCVAWVSHSKDLTYRLSAIVGDLESDVDFVRMSKACKSVHLKIRFTIRKLPREELCICLDLNDKKRSLIMEADKLDSAAGDHIPPVVRWRRSHVARLLRILNNKCHS